MLESKSQIAVNLLYEKNDSDLTFLVSTLWHGDAIDDSINMKASGPDSFEWSVQMRT